MFAKIKCAGLFGVHGFLAETEADSGSGIPGLYLPGALSQETREAQYRVSTAAKNSGIPLKPEKVTVNLSPASRRKEGTAFDLSILMAVLRAQGVLVEKNYPAAGEALFQTHAFLGELGLDGGLKPVRGILPMADALREAGIKALVVPRENAEEALLVPGLAVLPAASIRELLGFFQAERLPYAGRPPEPVSEEPAGGPDFSEIRGQSYLKRAAEIAVSGRHNILFSGAAGSGKTMIAKRMAGIMPPLSRKEQIELTKVYSACGLLEAKLPLIKNRPFRAPHHGSSAAALLGGGNPVRPGELSLASKGILFLDELPLFRREVIEALREPLEERKVVLTRLRGVYEFPADCMIAAACNNCPCGFFPDRERCRCTPAQIRMYQGRLSESYDAFYKSTWSNACQEAAFYHMACICARQGDFETALAHLDDAIIKNGRNYKALDLKAMLLLKTEREEQAHALAETVRSLDALDTTSGRILGKAVSMNHNHAIASPGFCSIAFCSTPMSSSRCGKQPKLSAAAAR